MLLERLREQTEQAAAIRRRAEQRIDRQFAPLRRQIALLQSEDIDRLHAIRDQYPDASCYKYDWLESRVFHALERLLRDRTAAHAAAHQGTLVEPCCKHVFIMTRDNVAEQFGDAELGHDAIARLVASCADAFLPAFRLDGLTVSASYSYEDTDVYVTLHVPTFP